ncbi:MAG TPA: pitrilysin family protein [Dehalococcoidia bacterium]|nr:pitrilysin family protein [Dehalococcoidia bacterium]
MVTAPMPHTRSVSVSIYVGAGSRYERPEQSGLSHFLEHMCFKGTEKRPTPREISEAIDSVGGVINAGTDRELTVYYCKVARPHFELALDVLVDMVRRPLLDPVELEKERAVVIEELASVADSPAQQVDILLDRTLWPDQPLGWDVAGTEETVSRIDREMALSYLRRQYVPNNMVLSVAGAVTHDEVVELARAQMGDWERGSPACWFPAVNGQRAPRAATLYKNTEQAHISAAVRGVSSWHPDRFALDLLSVALGEGMSSRLFQELRERRSLCYDVHTYVTHFLDAGAFTVYAGVDPGRAEEAITAALQELARARDEGLPEDELEKAKELSKGRLLLRMEDTRSVSGWYGGQELLNGRIYTADDVVGFIEAVTIEDIRRVARRLLVPRHLNLAVVGPFRGARRFQRLLSF